MDAPRIPTVQRAASDFMQVSRQWGSFFNHALTQRLEGDGPLSLEYIGEKLEAYESHPVQQHFTHLPQLLRESAEQHPEDAIYINNANFHTMSQAMLPLWKALLQPEKHPKIDDEDIRRIQTALAIQGLRLVRHLPLTPASNIDAATVGQATEIDAAIVALEVARTELQTGNPGLLVVPSPPAYEGHPTHPERSSDLMLIDTTAVDLAVRGIQVKTTPSKHHLFDSDYVSVVYGVTDLGNNVPGLIAADFLLNEQGGEASAERRGHKRRQSPRYTGAALSVRDVAVERLTLSARPYTQRAAAAARLIGPRVLGDLYHQEISA